MSIFQKFGRFFKETVNLSEYFDTAKAEESIRKNVYFRGPNAWILAFSIIIASIGLNVNSIPVIIGAMLISPLMGPIFGIGLSLGINDAKLLKTAVNNLLIMMTIAFLSSFIYFLITPLSLNNPTELLARTNPTIYDVLIALFGGFAGIFEMCRKEKGTVMSGVAIATALMPPLCTAGFGLASGNMSYFLGALYLFFINCIFIILATYLASKMLGFSDVQEKDAKSTKRTRWIMSIITVIVVIPSIISATVLIRNNEFESKAGSFVNENKTLDKAIIYDYKISHDNGNTLEVFVSGEALDNKQKSDLIQSARKHGIKEEQLVINEHASSRPESAEDIIKGIYEHSDEEIGKKDEEIAALKTELQKINGDDIPLTQIVREAALSYPVRELSINRGNIASADSLKAENSIVVVAKTSKAMSRSEKAKMLAWLKVRLGQDNISLFCTQE